MKVRFAVLAAVAGIGLAGSVQAATIETFDSAPIGGIGSVSGWYSTTGQATVAAGVGVNGTQGVTMGDPAFNWTAQTFDWTAMAVGSAVVIGGDWQSSSAGVFNDDRMGWTTTGGTGTSSTYHFGTQLDNEANNGFVTYWKVSGTTNYTQIMAFPTIIGDTWYRASTKITKLAAAAARLDVSLQQLDATGNPTGALYTGFLADTSLVASPAPASYFTNAVTPMLKNFNGTPGNFDNAVFDTVAVPEPTTLSLLGLAALPLIRRRRA